MKKSKIRQLKKICECLNDYECWLVLSHVKPDGDTLGSASALVQYALSRKTKVLWGGADEFSPAYSFLKGHELYHDISHIGELDLKCRYAAVALDTSNAARSVPGLTEKGPGTPGIVINIDHHGDNENYGDIVLVDPSCSSTGEILWNFFKCNRLNITKGIADALYTAIVTDSGNFSYSITSDSTHLAAADLLSRGVKPAEMNQLIYKNQTLAALNLWGVAFSRASLFEKGCIFSWLELSDFEKTGSAFSDTENLVSHFLFLKDIDFAVLLVDEGNKVRVSLRSNGSVSARQIAQIFGGGGHLPAAGCSLNTDLETAKTMVLKEISKYHVIGNIDAQ